MTFDHLPTRIAKWLVKHRHNFGTHDGLPGAFHRGVLYQSIRPGCKVAIQTCHGSLLVGKAVMVFHTHAVLNGGGRHGTPLIADDKNTIYCSDCKL
jgi:hypothetical protein